MASSTLHESLVTPAPLIMGILGHTNKQSEQSLIETVLTPLLQEVGRVPDRILLPSEGNSSIYLQEWAESLRIKTQIFHSDWKRHGKIAQILRDDRIKQESTHVLLFVGPRSKTWEKVVTSLVRKGTYVVTSSNDELVHWQLDAEGPDRKSDTKRGQPFLKFQA
jgi:hypothetical protein